MTSLDDTRAARRLLSAHAVRERADQMFGIAAAGKLDNFVLDISRLDPTASFVVDVIKTTYPDLDVKFHSRWRHFVFDGVDRWAPFAARFEDSRTRARAEFDLAILSVFLDAGAGAHWRYRDRLTGRDVGRSEGLAMASLDMFCDGAFSGRPEDPLRADAERLASLRDDALVRGFQTGPGNPLAGADGRLQLLRRIGQMTSGNPAVFAIDDTPRPGGFFDHLVARADRGRLSAHTILTELLEQFGPVWPSRLTLAGVPLGDCWRHPALRTDDITSGFMPLHKLSQWLAYSLIEPLQTSGITVTDITGLTGLAEYRNGGLLIDSGLLRLRDPGAVEVTHEISSPLVVEWRALTVALLDRLAVAVREKLGFDAESFPLIKLLEGGTWKAGRLLAARYRADGGPPLKIATDGTVF